MELCPVMHPCSWHTALTKKFHDVIFIGHVHEYCVMPKENCPAIDHHDDGKTICLLAARKFMFVLSTRSFKIKLSNDWGSSMSPFTRILFLASEEASKSQKVEKGKEEIEPLVCEFFGNPVIDIEKKRSVLDEIVQSSGLQPHTGDFLNILIDMKRVELVNDIVEEFEVEYNRMTDTESAVVTSVPSTWLRLPRAKNVRIKTVIDPFLVAGFTIRYGDSGSKLVDMSVRKQLDEIVTALDMG
ncbi:hypothetical protein Cgig2_028526 [Carnegiea gigantea]|uniref:Uncharacterized protein n=1 Tax=Carnegiea gigantea TaxID=171969 RepID=A0A9Q1JWJ3_9CARY|nr:hypothetical protein Cgig2_028526 [Carnegiea gigantea]